jgi:electron transfer flavoprotein beta subunit
VVKKVFAPAPRSEKAFQIDPAGGSDALASAAIDEIFKRLPMLERELIQPAQG